MSVQASLAARGRVEPDDDVVEGVLNAPEASKFGGMSIEELKPFAQTQNVNHEDEEGEGVVLPLDPRVWALAKRGGIKAVLNNLHTSTKTGPELDTLQSRANTFGVNRLPPPPRKMWITFFLESFEDPILIILIFAATVSLILGLTSEHPEREWIDGVAIYIAVLIVATVVASNDSKKQAQFLALKDEARGSRTVKVLMPNGTFDSVSIDLVAVGDIIALQKGDQLPADGIVLEGKDIKVNESSLTGEADDLARYPNHALDVIVQPNDGQLKLGEAYFSLLASPLPKVDSEEAVIAAKSQREGELKALLRKIQASYKLPSVQTENPFLLSGTVLTGGQYIKVLVLAVGAQSCEGGLSKNEESETETPLQAKLTVMAELIGYFGTGAAIATFVALMIVFGLTDTNKTWFDALIDAFIIGVTIIVVAIPEGLPLAVTISLAYSTGKMFEDKNLIRKLEACETMGNATDICSDKTGTLTENKHSISRAWLGGIAGDALAGRRLDLLKAFGASDLSETSIEAGVSIQLPEVIRKADDSSIEEVTPLPGSPDAVAFTSTDMRCWADAMEELRAQIDPATLEMLTSHLCLNSSDSDRYEPVDPQPSDIIKAQKVGLPTPIRRRRVQGSPTATAGLLMLQCMGIDPMAVRSEAYATQGAERFNPAAAKDAAAAEAGDSSAAGAASAATTADEGHAVDTTTNFFIQQWPFSSKKKRMATLARVTVTAPDGSKSHKIRLFVTGASERILSMCGNVRLVDATASPPEAHTEDIAAWKDKLEEYILGMAGQQLRTIGMAFRDWESWEAFLEEFPEETWRPQEGDGDDVSREDALMDASGLVFMSVYGIKDPLRAFVKDSITSCRNAGITVRMCTGDNLDTAVAIARECGILSRADLTLGEDSMSEDHFRNGLTVSELKPLFHPLAVMEGDGFRSQSVSALDETLRHLRVLARAKPEDKNILVRRLNGNLPNTRADWEKHHPGAHWNDRNSLLPGYAEEWRKKYHIRDDETGKSILFKRVVGVTGDGSNDAPALKAADVGLAMGIAGTDAAKDASDIVILDDNFVSIRKAVVWGRCVYDNIRRFLQFQLTVNVVALAITFIAAVSQREPPLNPVMMLWVNLIMDTMGALALGTEEPREKQLLARMPYHARSSLISRKMWRNILTQSAFQLIVLLVLLYSGESIFGFDSAAEGIARIDRGGEALTSEERERYLSTFIFNAFVFCQVFNELNARNIEDDINILHGLHTNPIFIGVIVVTVGLQIFIVEVGGEFTKTTGLAIEHWGWTILLGFISIPVGVLMRFIPVDNDPRDEADYWISTSQKQMDAALAARTAPASSSVMSAPSVSTAVVPRAPAADEASHV